MTAVAGLDVGTTSIRAGVFDEAGRRISMTQRRLGIQRPFDGAVEQDPSEIRDVAVDLLREALKQSGLRSGDLAAIGIANQRSTVVAWDAVTGQPLCPAVGWQDTRTADRVAEFRANGIPLTTTASCSKVEWLLANEESLMEARRSSRLRLGTIDAWLTSALTSDDAFQTDPSNAGATGFYDAQSGDWSEFVVEMFGAEVGLLPEVVATNAVAGTTPVDLLGSAVPVAARAGDQQASCYAHGISQGEAKLTLGTSGMLDASTGAVIGDAPDGTYALPLWRLDGEDSEPDQFCIEGSINTAGAVVEWLVSVGLLQDVESLDGIAGQARNPAVFVPAMAGLGSPRLDPMARALIGAVGLDTTAPDIVAGALRGIAARAAQIADLLDVGDEMLVDGGLSRSTIMLQTVADLTGRTVRPSTDVETTLRGAAMLAADAVGSRVAAPVDDSIEPIDPSISEDERREIRDRHETFEAVTHSSP